jgi:beta-lactamase class A
MGESRVKVFTAILVAVLGVVALGVSPGDARAPSLPFCSPDPEWRPLSQRWDKKLQARLEQALNRHASWQPLLSQGKMAVGLVDLSNPKAPRYARVNGNTTMYAASLPKLGVLLAAFQGFEDGSLKETGEIHRDLIEMIRRSSNAASYRMINRIGLKRIEALMRDRRYRFYDPSTGGGIWVGGTYSNGGEENLEAHTGRLYTASAYQICRFYYLLAYGRLINPGRSGQMLKVLAFPDLPGKFVKALSGTVPPNRLYRKSGEVRGFHADSVLVWTGTGRRYILVALVDDDGGEQILRDLVPVAESVLRIAPPRWSVRSKKKQPMR